MTETTISLPESYTVPAGYSTGAHWSEPGRSGWYLVRETDGEAIRVSARPDLVEVDEDEASEHDGSHHMTIDEVEEQIAAAFLALDEARVDSLVLVEVMPGHLRASHEAAGNIGRYPANGARRYLVSRDLAESLADEWTEIVRDARKSDVGDYAMDIDGEQVAQA